MGVRVQDREGPHAVYRHWSAEGVCLYIGATANPEQRWKAHTYHARWAQEVVRITLEWFPDFASARAEERRAIREEAPRHNVAGRAAVWPVADRPGPQALDRWLSAQGEGRQEFANRLGVYATTVDAYLRGDHNPSVQVVAMIEALTDGEVGAALWPVTRQRGLRRPRVCLLAAASTPGPRA